MFCWHKWTISAVGEQVTRPETSITYEAKFTNVVYTCSKCGAITVALLDGHWTKEDLIK